jgi:hypothetical protein
MSLNWDARKCGERWEALPPEKRESLIFATMFVDMGEITEANHQEFYKRYVQFNMACGYPDLYLTAQDIKDAIGLNTNVSTTTPAAWKKFLIKKLEEKANEKVTYAFKELDKKEASNG